MVRIMVAIDGDKSSEHAFHEAMKVYDPKNDKLYLVSVYDLLSVYIPLPSFFPYFSSPSSPPHPFLPLQVFITWFPQVTKVLTDE